MNTFYKGVAVAVLHLMIVLSLGGKLLYDRAHRPRVWVRTGSIDPDLPVRGRYLTLNVQLEAPWFDLKDSGYQRADVQLKAENGELVAVKSESPTGLSVSRWGRRSGSAANTVFLDQPIVFFIPEHALMPQMKPGEQLWAEVTVPGKGPPRPIQLALKTATEWKVLEVK